MDYLSFAITFHIYSVSSFIVITLMLSYTQVGLDFVCLIVILESLDY